MKEKKPLPLYKESVLPEPFDPIVAKIAGFIENHSKTLLYGLGALLLLLVALYFLFTSNEKASFGDYLKVKPLYSRYLAAEPENSLVPYAELTAILDRHPELKDLYSSEITEAQLIKGENPSLAPYVARLEKAQMLSFAEFTATTSLIQSKQFDEALKESLALKERLSSDSTLYAANLIRIAALSRELQKVKEEREAILELLKDPSRLLKETKAGAISFEEYFKWRLKQLES